jgi:hypothetical protein
MKLTLVERPSVPPSASPYRLLDEHGQEVAWANAFLDAQRIRQLSLLLGTVSNMGALTRRVMILPVASGSSGATRGTNYPADC